MLFQDEYLKVDEVARLLRVSIRTIYRRIQAGQLPARKFGGLYYIRKADLDAQLAGGTLPAADLPQTEGDTAPTLKCSSCLRIIRSPNEIGALCHEEGCDALLCRHCADHGVQYCPQHLPSPQALCAEYEQQYEAGDLKVFVKSTIARARELNFLQRIHIRLSRVSAIEHPLSGETLDIASWDSILEQGDQRQELMRLMGRVYLDKDSLQLNPLNAWTIYRITSRRGQKGSPLIIQVQCLSRLDSMVKRGCDTQNLSEDFLVKHLNRIDEALRRETSFRILVLASTSGWDSLARKLIAGSTVGEGYLHPRCLVYLFDLESGELIYNKHDQKAARYAALFYPLTEAEELYEATELIKKQLLLYDNLTLETATITLSLPSSLVEKAFRQLEASGDFRLLSVPDLGLAIVRRN